MRARYRLLRPFCRGGVSDLYLARDMGNGLRDRLIVLKTPRGAPTPFGTRMLLEEGRLSMGLDHPSVIRVLGAVRGPQRSFLAMEFLWGRDLAAIHRAAAQSGRRPCFGFSCRIVADVLGGLGRAHAAGIVHRDVSPSNVILGFDGRTKLIDFGIAKPIGAPASELTFAGSPKGKAAYMSPEQVACAPLDARADVFSAGVVLWELLTGRRLFARANEPATLGAGMGPRSTAPSVLNPAVPASLDRLVARALFRDRAARFPDAASFAAALEELIEARRWSALPSAMSHYLGELFAEDLRRVEARLRASGAPTLDEYLLDLPPSSPLPWSAAPSAREEDTIVSELSLDAFSAVEDPFDDTVACLSPPWHGYGGEPAALHA
jgi:serine/threonine-protein kinase